MHVQREVHGVIPVIKVAEARQQQRSAVCWSAIQLGGRNGGFGFQRRGSARLYARSFRVMQPRRLCYYYFVGVLFRGAQTCTLGGSDGYSFQAYQ